MGKYRESLPAHFEGWCAAISKEKKHAFNAYSSAIINSFFPASGLQRQILYVFKPIGGRVNQSDLIHAPFLE